MSSLVSPQNCSVYSIRTQLDGEKMGFRNEFTLTKRKFKTGWISYYYTYEFGKRVKHSTGEKSKASEMERILSKVKDGTIHQDKVSLITFKEFSGPWWIWDSCPYIRDRIMRGGHYSKNLCKSNRQNLEKHILPT